MQHPPQHPAARNWRCRTGSPTRKPIRQAFRADLHRALVQRNRPTVLEAVIVGLRRQARGQVTVQRRACHLRLRNGAVVGQVVGERLVQARAAAGSGHKSYLCHQHRARATQSREDQQLRPSGPKRPAQIHDPYTARIGRRFPLSAHTIRLHPR